MTDKQMLLKMIEHGEKMRDLQQQFFKNGKLMPREQRQDLIARSKQAEREFDNVLFNVKQLSK